MFTCFWKLWDWLDPAVMDNKKYFTSNDLHDTHGNGAGLAKHKPSTVPQQLNLMQYGTKPVEYSVPPDNRWATNQQSGQLNKEWQHFGPQQILSKTFEYIDNRKRSTAGVGGGQQLRSPAAKRSSQGAATMKGWLHKQGSDGLKVWRKRWFVLADYCLYYYKGSEEEKVLGSILLPSYKVSVCGSDDKMCKKFSFKCEHVNMRTYYLAADSLEIMMDWVRALNVACTLQSNITSCTYYKNVENKEPGFHQQQPHQQQPQQHHPQQHHSQQPPPRAFDTSADMYSCSNMSENPSSPSYSFESNSCPQPLYVNAPPKPKRLTDGGYCSQSPDTVADPMKAYQYKHVIMSPYGYASSKSPVRYCENRVVFEPPGPYMPPAQCSKANNLYGHQVQCVPQMRDNVERRTPDTYGRSKLISDRVRDVSDYEDLYADDALYRRPLSPVTYSNIKKINSVSSINAQYSYNPVTIAGPSRPSYILVPDNKLQQQLPKRSQLNSIRRPHSADFLEYEVKHRNTDPFVNKVNAQQPRPKSSLDISRVAPDSDYYSKENYAEHMRKSALLLQQLPTHYHVKRYKPLVMFNGQKMPPKYHYATEPPPFSRKIQVYVKDPEFSRNEHVSDDSFDTDFQSYPYAKSPLGQEFVENKGACLNAKDCQSDLFKRSASARLLKNSVPSEKFVHDEHVNVSKEGERKREESMKRLLEWKQRMLQSPLNRKVSSNLTVSSNMTDRSDYFQRQTLSTPNYEYLSSPDERRSLTALSQYSSCSSDDEENDLDRSKKEKVVRSKLLQAGRTKEGHPDKSVLTYSPALNHSTTSVFNVQLSPGDKRPITNSFIKDTMNLTATANNEHLTSDNADVTVIESDIEPNLALKSDATSFSTSSKTDDNSFVSLIQQSPVENRDYEYLVVSSSQLVPDSSATFEDVYMTMTPKKSVLATDVTQTKQSDGECEESAYMEMTKGLNVSLLDQNEMLPTDNLSVNTMGIQYEVIGFGENKIEPVYMELNNPLSTDPLMLCNLTYKLDENEKLNLSDILIDPKNEPTRSIKSDSSDADDEASKDLNSLDTPYHPRFSLSDTFRPASYYLSNSRVLTKFQDSSDSELVSPPFIPTTPSFTDDLSNPFFKNDAHFDELPAYTKLLKSKNQAGLTEVDDSYYLSADALKEKDEAFMNEIEKCYSARLCPNVDSDTELRSCKSSDREYMLKRRPVSEEFCDVFECFSNHTNELIANTNLDTFLNNLEQNSLNMSTNTTITKHMFNNSSLSNEFIPEHDYEDLYMLQNVVTHSVGESKQCGGKFDQYFQSVENIKSVPELEVEKTSLNDKLKYSLSYNYSNLPEKKESDSGFLALKSNQEDANLEREIKRSKSVSLDFLNEANQSELSEINSNLLQSGTNRVKIDNILSYNGEEVEDANSILQNEVTKDNDTWVEDSLTVCHRHTRSLNDLDNISEPEPKVTKPKLHRGAVYVNDNVLNTLCLSNQDKWRQIIGESDSAQEQESTDSNTNEIWNITSTMLPAEEVNCKLSESKSATKLNKTNFTIDRETLRQWDLLSSATSETNEQRLTVPLAGPVVDVVEQGTSKHIVAQACEQTEFHAQDPESGSVSLNARETIPRTITERMWSPNSQMQSRSPTVHLAANYESDYLQSNQQLVPQGPPNLNEYDVNHYANLKKSESALYWNDKINMSAGELLSRTHEELVLLLIQLRRQSTNTCRAIEMYYSEIDNIQSQLHEMDEVKRLEHLEKIRQLRQHLLELEKQYEKRKPLVNLVDNMVKLGSLYRNPNDYGYIPNVRNRLEFNQQIQEQRLLAEEKRDWNRLSPNHIQLQTKVQQLYQLDRLLQEESDTLHGLQHNKVKIERALGELRHRLNVGHKDLNEIEQARKQRAILENELSRVHFLLAQNSKKLEETVAGNARLEQELLVLRQKLQLSKQQRCSLQFSNAGDSLPCVGGTSALLEAELYRVQALVGDLQRQRQELSLQVRQLTDRSRTLSQQIHRPCIAPVLPSESQTNNKHVTTYWRETDLDTMQSFDHGTELHVQNKFHNSHTNVNKQMPLVVEYHCNEGNPQIIECLPQERPEIKTVRIVKRESERRQRDREKTGISDNIRSQQKYDTVLEESDFCISNSQNDICSNSLQLETDILSDYSLGDNEPITIRHSNLNRSNLTKKNTSDNYLSLDESPVFKSETACQIITEMSGDCNSKSNALKNSARRTVPKEKRRHYTAPHNNYPMKNLSSLQTNELFKNLNTYSRRARDDLDMERALRQRTDTPDVVRSTLSSKELKYNESTIDNLLGTPNKISIPERYIPEQLPQLSAEEQQQRLQKVESIKKMLSDSTIISTVPAPPPSENAGIEKPLVNNATKATCKINEEKRQREHLLELNQILAKQVMEMSKIVAVRALTKLPLEPQDTSAEEDDLSPVTPLPLYQQRHCYYN